MCPSTALGTGRQKKEKLQERKKKNLCLHEACILVGKDRQKISKIGIACQGMLSATEKEQRGSWGSRCNFN